MASRLPGPGTASLGNGNVHLEVRPRISEIDDTRNVVIQNFTVPSLTVREVDTAVEMKAGQTFALAGLVQQRTESQMRGLPYVSDIPVIGNLFTDNGSNKQKLNLLVFLTPHVVRTREDLRALALDERQKFSDALGRRELHQMPMEQYKQLYQPTFSVPVPRAGGIGVSSRAGISQTPDGRFQQR